MEMRPIHLFGDSIGKGIMFDEGRGRYALARERCDVRLQAALNVPVENHSMMGITVADGLRDLKECGDLSGALVAIEYGGNDCDLNWAEVAADPRKPHQAKVPLPEFRALLRQFVKEVRQRGAQPLLVTPPPLHARRFFEWVSKGLDKDAILVFMGDVQSIYHWQERYAIAARDVALELHCEVFDLRDAFLSLRDVMYDHICIDGMHPNAKGHAFIAETALLPDRPYFKGRALNP